METKEILRKQLELLAERSKTMSAVCGCESLLVTCSHAMCEIAHAIRECGDQPSLDTIADEVARRIAAEASHFDDCTQ